jgi:hypothetical protein
VEEGAFLDLLSCGRGLERGRKGKGGEDVLGGRRGSFLCGALEREEAGFGEGGWGAIWGEED